MGAAVLLWSGGRTFLVEPVSRRVEPLTPAKEFALPSRPWSPPELGTITAFLERLGPGSEVHLGEPEARAGLAAAGLRVRPAELGELRAGREIAPRPPFGEIRSSVIAEARRRLEHALASPEESLIALAREEERVERVQVRELGAADQWVSGTAGPLADYGREWAGFRDNLAAHHLHLESQLDAAARRCAPNLTALVGGRVAGRLVAAAGGLVPLARMSASRLQLLGTRRRPGGNRGPKYGVIARAVHAADVPPGRHGALARSLAALAAIAARADASTRADISRMLLARRDRRIERLRGTRAG